MWYYYFWLTDLWETCLASQVAVAPTAPDVFSRTWKYNYNLLDKKVLNYRMPAAKSQSVQNFRHMGPSSAKTPEMYNKKYVMFTI